MELPAKSQEVRKLKTSEKKKKTHGFFENVYENTIQNIRFDVLGQSSVRSVLLGPEITENFFFSADLYRLNTNKVLPGKPQNFFHVCREKVRYFVSSFFHGSGFLFYDILRETVKLLSLQVTLKSLKLSSGFLIYAVFYCTRQRVNHRREKKEDRKRKILEELMENTRHS